MDGYWITSVDGVIRGGGGGGSNLLCRKIPKYNQFNKWQCAWRYGVFVDNEREM
jgi:hypothetical protein